MNARRPQIGLAMLIWRNQFPEPVARLWPANLVRSRPPIEPKTLALPLDDVAGFTSTIAVKACGQIPI